MFTFPRRVLRSNFWKKFKFRLLQANLRRLNKKADGGRDSSYTAVPSVQDPIVGKNSKKVAKTDKQKSSVLITVTPCSSYCLAQNRKS